MANGTREAAPGCWDFRAAGGWWEVGGWEERERFWCAEKGDGQRRLSLVFSFGWLAAAGDVMGLVCDSRREDSPTSK
ncbi:hypothetical protein M440DRAFT_1402263 [Trichoderma longibrachiatum ATCC 18648]|uniref:Uncharacterized protein n=1 Tax=Trichoderma longibrachiatum ATCC 18648 TaxID=983965 RepID=A0A2T4C2E1_TRILO|nr:hypothetical protein M440DRAFT_1402263 [Trichoderma longibrachiatum ATCC 18648]